MTMQSTGYGGRTATKTTTTETPEGPVARAIEEQTAKIPSDVFLWTAGAALLGSLALKVSGRDKTSMFVGQWVPTLLILGTYNKLVKLLGHDQNNRLGV